MMTREQFVDAALVCAPIAIVEGETDAMRERTEGMMRDDAARMYDAGWTLEDVVALFRCMEHVSPDLPEDVALRRMHAIHQKYEKGGSR